MKRSDTNTEEYILSLELKIDGLQDEIKELENKGDLKALEAYTIIFDSDLIPNARKIAESLQGDILQESTFHLFDGLNKKYNFPANSVIIYNSEQLNDHLNDGDFTDDTTSIFATVYGKENK